MNCPNRRQVLDCGSPLPLSDGLTTPNSGRGLPHSKTLPCIRETLTRSHNVWSARGFSAAFAPQT